MMRETFFLSFQDQTEWDAQKYSLYFQDEGGKKIVMNGFDVDVIGSNGKGAV